MTIVLNGSAVEVSDAATIADAVALAGPGLGFGVAVALNSEVVPRARWDERSLSDGDRVEVLVAAQGG